MEQVEGLASRDVLFYRYVSKKQQELRDGQVNREELDDLLTEVLDFIWNHLKDEERRHIDEVG